MIKLFSRSLFNDYNNIIDLVMEYNIYNFIYFLVWYYT